MMDNYSRILRDCQPAGYDMGVSNINRIVELIYPVKQETLMGKV